MEGAFITPEQARIIGQNVRRKRYDMRITQAHMASMICIKLRSYQRIENGKSIMRLNEIMKVLAVMGEPFEWFLVDRGAFTKRVRPHYRKQSGAPDSSLSGTSVPEMPLMII